MHDKDSFQNNFVTNVREADLNGLMKSLKRLTKGLF